MADPLVVYGAGGSAREVAWLAETIPGFEVVAFIDDDARHHGELVNDIPVMGFSALKATRPDAYVALGVGNPKTREILADRVQASGFRLATLIHPGVAQSRWNRYHEGVVVCAGTILTVNITLGRGVQINIDCTVAHDAVLGDFATLAPGVHISGNVHVGPRAYLGTGAVVINGIAGQPLIIGHDAVIGAGACVVRDVPPGTTVVGVPAKAR